MRVVCIAVPGENSFYRSPRGEIGPEDVCRVPLAAVRHGRARQTSESGLCGDCRGVLWVPGPRGQYSGKFWTSSVSGQSGVLVSEFNVTELRKSFPKTYIEWRKCRGHDNDFIFDWIIIKCTGNQNRCKILDESCFFLVKFSF